jgi:hypothetical protein
VKGKTIAHHDRHAGGIKLLIANRRRVVAARRAGADAQSWDVRIAVCARETVTTSSNCAGASTKRSIR